MLRSLAALALVAGCHSPTFRDCEVQCTPASGCPEGFTCGAEGRCREPDNAASCREVLDDGAGVVRQSVLEVRSLPNRDLDLLFVIDDSPSMADKQMALRDAFPMFVQQLTLDDGLPNLHVGVISTDMGTKGSAVATPGPAIGQINNGGCSGTGKSGLLTVNGAPVSGPFLSDIDAGGTRLRNYTGTFEAAFRQMISLGAGGCGFEQHLHATRIALTNSVENAGFLRPNASLGVILLTDEDDCSILDPTVLGPQSTMLGPQQSFRCFEFGVECAPDDPRAVGPKAGCKTRTLSPYMEDIAPFRTFLAGLKPDPRQVLFGVFGGVATPVAVELRAPTGGTPIPSVVRTCNYTTPTGAAIADPGVRLAQLVEGFPGRGRYESVCSADLGPVLSAMGRTARQLVGDTCIDKPIGDRSPDPGVQPDCVVEDTRGVMFATVRACTDKITDDCFELVEDAARCTGQAHHLKLVVHRSTPPPGDQYTVVRCTAP